MKKHFKFGFLPALIFACGCQSLYFGAMEKIGVHKRDIMVGRIKAARQTQSDTKEQFVSAIEAFRSVVKFDGGSLEKEYERLNGILKKSERSAEELRARIRAVEDVSGALFKEWRGEIKRFSSKDLRRSSREKYDLALDKYESLIEAMKKAEAKLEPALTPLRDQVLYLKHNLNAKALAGLGEELIEFQGAVNNLVAELDASVAEADNFILIMEEK